MSFSLKNKRLTSFQIIILGFAGVILFGAFLLMLPISSAEASVTPFFKALFTSTSAVCVTGLVVYDTAVHWSYFGQAVILILIQIGGLGVVTIAASFALLSGRKISLMQRSTMQEAVSAQKVGGIVRLTLFILKATFIFEFIGALALMPFFCRDFGYKGIWMAFFHSISAFCNAGFDILGQAQAQFSSLTAYADNVPFNITVMLLIIIGGLGFLTWEDVYTNKFHFKRYRMQSKVIFSVTLALIIIPAALFFILDFSELPMKERILYSLFQSVTPRTAGFNTADLTKLTQATRAVMIVLMLIGGSPGSTAGGMKTTTFAVLISNAICVFRRKEDPVFFGRRISAEAVRSASTIFFMYISMFFSGAVIISLVENLPMSTCIFETASAVGTVGLTLGITPQLSSVSQLVLIFLMFFGRVGGLNLIYAAFSSVNQKLSKAPLEKITVG